MCYFAESSHREELGAVLMLRGILWAVSFRALQNLWALLLGYSLLKDPSMGQILQCSSTRVRSRFRLRLTAHPLPTPSNPAPATHRPCAGPHFQSLPENGPSLRAHPCTFPEHLRHSTFDGPRANEALLVALGPAFSAL